MGLRELKAERTRNDILNAALALFEQQGYDATTMEQIAQAAFVSPSTLYRYFPAKERTILEHSVLSRVQLSDLVRDRPREEALPDALGHALHAYLEYVDANQELIGRLRSQMDAIPVVRGLVWDNWYREHVVLEETIAIRLGKGSADLHARLSASVTLMVVQMALDETRAGHGHPTASDFADRAMRLLHQTEVPFIRFPTSAERVSEAPIRR